MLSWLRMKEINKKSPRVRFSIGGGLIATAFVALVSAAQADDVEFKPVSTPEALHIASNDMLMYNMNTDAMDSLSRICPKGTVKASLWARMIFRKYQRQVNVKDSPNYTVLVPDIEERARVGNGWYLFKGLESNHSPSDYALSRDSLKKNQTFAFVQCYDKQNKTLIGYKNGSLPLLSKPKLEQLKNLEIRLLYNLALFGSNNQREILSRYPNNRQIYGRLYIYTSKINSGYPSSDLAITFGNLDKNFVDSISTARSEQSKLNSGDFNGRVWYRTDESAPANPGDSARLSWFNVSQSLFDVTRIASMISGEFNVKYNNYFPPIFPKRFINVFNGWPQEVHRSKKQHPPLPKPRPKHLKKSGNTPERPTTKTVVEPAKAEITPKDAPSPVEAGAAK